MASPSRSRSAWATPVRLTLIVLLVLVAVLTACEVAGWSFLRRPLERQLARTLDRGVTLSRPFSLHLLGRIRLQVGELVIDQPQWVLSGDMQSLGPLDRPMVDLRSLDVRIPYSCLWHLATGGPAHACRITAIRVDQADALLARTAAGRANWALGPDDPHPPSTPGHPADKLPQVDRLEVRQGRLQLHDAALMLDADARVSTLEGRGVSEARGLRVEGSGTYRGNSFSIGMRSEGAMALLAPEGEAPAVPLTVQAQAGGSRASFRGHSRDALKLDGLDGEVEVQGPSLAALGDLAGLSLPATARFAMTGHLTRRGAVWGMRVQELALGSSRLSGDFTFDRSRPVPELRGELHGTRLALADLGPAFGAPAPGASNPAPPDGRVLPTKTFDVPSFKAMNAAVKVRLQRVALGSWFAQDLQPLDADLSLRAGVLRLDNLLASAAGGRVTGAFQIDSGRNPLDWSARVQWRGIDLRRWLKPPAVLARAQQGEAPRRPARGKPAATASATASAAVPADGKPATGPSFINGRLAGEANLHGRGNSTAAWLASLEGGGRVWIDGGSISGLVVEAAGLHLLEALGLLISGDELLPLQCAAARFTAREGVIRTDVGIVDTPPSTLLLSGGVSLATERLGLTVTSRPRHFALVSLRTPLDIEGSFAAPRISLRSRPLGERVLGAAALGAVAPLAALVALVDPGDPSSHGCQQALQTLRGQGHPAQEQRLPRR